MKDDYKVIIGLEVHVELNTESKAFCSCSTNFGAKPNINTCPICLALPGTLPSLNKKVIEYAIKSGLALNCTINPLFTMDRKNYFYPDNPKNYQITQKNYPICEKGYIDIEDYKGNIKTINIERIHVEEDAGKLIHIQDKTLVDFNRAGVPLIEIVTYPDLCSAEEAVLFVKTLKAILTTCGVSNCKMEEGSLRVDGNISIKNERPNIQGNRVELKNINSFKSLEKALNYEIDRQIQLMNMDKNIKLETRRWDNNKGITIVMRDKEEGEDYRYFPEGDLTAYKIEESYIYKISQSIPELPRSKYKRFISDYELSSYEADILSQDINISNFFEKAALRSGEPKEAANLILGEVFRILKDRQKEIQNFNITGYDLGELILILKEGVISSSTAKVLMEKMFLTGKSAKDIIEEENLSQNNDKDSIDEIVQKVFNSYPKVVEEYKDGKRKVITFLIGMVMKESKGRANPDLVKDIILKKLNEA